MAFSALAAFATLALAIWLYLVLAHGRFWLCDQSLDRADLAEPPVWPEVVAVIPARNESAVIGPCIASLLAQDYPGPWRVVLVDDHSEDGTRAAAEQAASAFATATERLTVVEAAPLPPGWSGKLWAVAEGIQQAHRLAPEARWLLLTDADIRHDSGSLRRLVAKAELTPCALVSQMVLLDHRGWWAGLLIPAFVFFFQKLYPFPLVNDPAQRMAAAAGGCILVRQDALAAAGGIACIRGALIDDCSLAAAIKAGGGRLWLGLTARLVSLRPYSRFQEIWDMVARTAYTQLNHAPLLLAGALLGMFLTYLVGPLAFLTWPCHGDALAAAAGLAAWLLMIVAWRPTLRLYGKPTVAGVLLPLVGLLYSLMTLDSAVRHWRGRGGQWKGRVYQATAGQATAGQATAGSATKGPRKPD